MKVLILSPFLSKLLGGLPYSVIGLTNSLIDAGIDITLVSTFRNFEKDFVKSDFAKQSHIKLFPSYSYWRYSHALKIFLSENLGSSNLLHIHGLWYYPHYIASMLAKRLKIPVLLTPHGMLEHWALQHKNWKKNFYYQFIEKQNIETASAIHVFTEREKLSCEEKGIIKDYSIISNGVNAFILPAAEEINIFRKKFNLNANRIILFLGRLHPIKGIDILVRAFGNLLKSNNAWKLVLAGADEEGYKQKIEQEIFNLGISSNVVFTGMITGSEKQAALAVSEVFALTSYSEGASMALLEAMAAGKAILITKRCNFNQIEEIKAGVVVDTNVESVSEGLLFLCSKPEEDLVEIGKMGRKLVDEKYNWRVIAFEMINLYTNLIAKYYGHKNI